MMEPNVRQMIVCEDARTRPGSHGKIDVFGIMTKVTARSFPFNLSFAVYLCLTNGRGTGQGRICVKKALQEEAVYVGDSHEFLFGDDPLRLHPFMIRIFSCRLSDPGLYSIDFVYNEVVLESYTLLVEKLA
jgi:hypothetical protein